MSETMIEARGLTKFFRTRREKVLAVDRLSFSCQKGEIFGLLGPNGAGKTTTLRMLATILTPNAGSAAVAGFDTRTAPGRVRSNIGFLATETGLYERHTAWETLNFFGRINKLSAEEIKNRAEKILDMLGLSSLADRRVGTLSTGERQKLSVARSLIHDPPVLIFDEPTYGLDVMAARTVIDTVRLFRQQGRTILLSTHIMRVAEKLCDRIGILYRGRLHALGTIPQLREQFGQEDLEEVFFTAVGGL